MPPLLADVLWKQMPVGILRVNAQKRILECNPAAERLLDMGERGLVGQTLLQATLSYEMQSLISQAYAQRSLVEKEVRLTHEHGLSVLKAKVIPIPSERIRTADEFWLLLEDVSELRRLETIRRDFVANVSHELRTPLASIRAMAETLQDGALLDMEISERFVGLMVVEVERLTRLLEDILVLSRAESRPPEREPFSLAELIEHIAGRFATQAERAHVSLSYVAPPPLMLNANRDQMEQVLINLVDNAIKYTPEGGNVKIVAEETAEGMSVAVSDTGIGIMSQDLPRVFERFYRVDKARSRRSGGTGLGLSIVKNIVEMHNGTVTVQSEYGRGSTFTFVLPHVPYEKGVSAA